MQSFRSFVDQLMSVWNDSTPAARVGISMLAIIMVGGIIGVGMWSSQPDYVVINADLKPGDTNTVINALSAENISYQLNGRQLLVDERRQSEAKAILKETGIVSDSGTYNLESIDSLGSPLAQKGTALRNRERKIKSQLESLKAVRTAEVSLTMPESRRYLRRTAPATAAVILDVDNSRFGLEQAYTVAQIVAKSVPNLNPKNVTITDTLGNDYDLDQSLRNLSKQQRRRFESERDLEFKIRSLLGKEHGLDNVQVIATLDMDFTDQEKKQVIYDIDNKLVTSQTTDITKERLDRRDPVGPSGVEANNRGIGSANSPVVVKDTEKKTTTTEAPTTEIVERIKQPVVKKKSVAVFINKNVLAQGVDLAVEKAEMEQAIQTAIGYEKNRDQVTVSFRSFEEIAPVETVATPIPWDQIHQVLRNISLGLAGLVAFLLAFMTYRKWTPSENTPSPVLASKQSQVERLREMVKEHPEIVEKIISAWSKSDNSSETAEPKSQAA